MVSLSLIQPLPNKGILQNIFLSLFNVVMQKSDYFYRIHKTLICYFPPLSCSPVLHKVQDLPGEVEKKMQTNSEISNKQNAWFLQILNSWWCYLARWPSAHSRQSGVAWPDLLSAARLAGGWGEPREREREKGRRDRQKRTRANKIPDACTRNTHKTKLAWTRCHPPLPPTSNMLRPSVFLHK